MKDLVLLVRQVPQQESWRLLFSSGFPQDDPDFLLLVLCIALTQNQGGIWAAWEWPFHPERIFQYFSHLELKERLQNLNFFCH